MRKKEEIIEEVTHKLNYNRLILEVLLDLRDLMSKKSKKNEINS